MNIEERVIELRIEVAKQGAQIHNLVDKVDGISDSLDDIKKVLTGESQKASSWARSTLTKVILVILAGSFGAGATTAAVQAMKPDPAPTTIEQPVPY